MENAKSIIVAQRSLADKQNHRCHKDPLRTPTKMKNHIDLRWGISTWSGLLATKRKFAINHSKSLNKKSRKRKMHHNCAMCLGRQTTSSWPQKSPLNNPKLKTLLISRWGSPHDMVCLRQQNNATIRSTHLKMNLKNAESTIIAQCDLADKQRHRCRKNPF